MKSLVLTIALMSVGAFAAQAEVIPTAPTEAVARGEYLATKVIQCIQCHSPHDREGNLLGDQLFTGQAIPFTSPFPDGPRWAPRAPAIKRLPGWSVQEFVSILTTGKRLNGHRPASPMPQFRMSMQDAEAIAAYLKSL